MPQMWAGVGRKLASRECERITAEAGAAYQNHYTTATAPAPRLAVMCMKRADLGARAPNPRPRRKRVPAMRKEITQWVPSRWTSRKLSRFLKHAIREAMLATTDLIGPYEGALIGAELLAKLKDIRSAALLRLAGVKTLGDGGADDSQSKA